MYRGYLEERGRLRGPGPNGGSIVVCEADLDARVKSPPIKAVVLKNLLEIVDKPIPINYRKTPQS